MVLGNPFKFAFIVDLVPAWGEDNFKAGLFHIIIDGQPFPHLVENTSLSTDLGYVFGWDGVSTHTSPAFINPPVDLGIFSISDKREAFLAMYGAFYPPGVDANFEESQDYDQEYKFKLSTTTIEDSGQMIFAVSNSEDVKILGSRLLTIEVCGKNGEVTTIDEPEEVYEAVLTKKEYFVLIESLRRFYKSKVEMKC